MKELEDALFELRVQVLLCIARRRRLSTSDGMVRAYARTMRDNEVFDTLQYRSSLLGRLFGRFKFGG